MRKNSPYISVDNIKTPEYGAVRTTAKQNGDIIKKVFLECFDILVNDAVCGGRKITLANCDGLTNSRNVADAVMKPLLSFSGQLPDKNTLEFIGDTLICLTEQSTETSLDEAMKSILRGNLCLFVDGCASCIVIGVQKIPERSVDEPDTEVQEHGSREGFVETIKTNLTLVRKRMVTVNFKVETMEIGASGNTKVCICYMDGLVKEEILTEVRERLNSVELDTLLGAGYLQPFLDTKRKTMFSMVGTTERPDTFCAKITEGKVGILVDGTPFALVVPRLFIENFQTLDDYLNRPYFAAFMRAVRVVSFLLSILLPGVYVAIGLFHQELLPDDMLYNIVMMESNTMFTLTIEALIIHFVYEVVREAGLRMPKSIGHAVSIVGALVIGDAAVTAGLIGAPMLIVVAMTAITSLVASDLYQPISVLRIVFIIIAGSTGLYGIMIGVAVLILNLAAVTDYGVCFLSPLTPYNRALWRDTLTRRSFLALGKKQFLIGSMKTEGK